MIRFAVAQEDVERELDPDIEQADLLQRVKKSVMVRFPDKFPKQKAQRSRRVPGGESGSTKVRGGGSAKFADYPQEVLDIANQFERNGIMTKVEYLKQLKAGEA